MAAPPATRTASQPHRSSARPGEAEEEGPAARLVATQAPTPASQPEPGVPPAEPTPEELADKERQNEVSAHAVRCVYA
jgi:hypothetical protein